MYGWHFSPSHDLASAGGSDDSDDDDSDDDEEGEEDFDEAQRSNVHEILHLERCERRNSADVGSTAAPCI